MELNQKQRVALAKAALSRAKKLNPNRDGTPSPSPHPESAVALTPEQRRKIVEAALDANRKGKPLLDPANKRPRSPSPAPSQPPPPKK